MIFIPQLFAAAVGIAGLSALVGSALRVSMSGSHVVYAVVVIALSTALVATGGYRGIERVATAMAAVLIVLSLAAALQVAPGAETLASGLNPVGTASADFEFILPWVGTILAGSMGIIWYAYWVAAAGFAGPSTQPGGAHPDDPRRPYEDMTTEARIRRVEQWVKISGRAAAAGVALGALVILAFMVLGSELLAPEQRIPSGVDVAGDLGQLLEGVWGEFGFWALILTTIFALGGSVMANQDGWSRSFADITRLFLAGSAADNVDRNRWLRPATLRLLYVAGITGAIPIAVVMLVEDPVAIMSTSGTIGAVHTPFIVFLILLVNRIHLPREVRPGILASTLLGSAGVFYAVFAILRLTVSID